MASDIPCCCYCKQKPYSSLRRHYGIGRRRLSIARRSSYMAFVQHVCHAPCDRSADVRARGKKWRIAPHGPWLGLFWATSPCEGDVEESASSRVGAIVCFKIASAGSDHLPCRQCLLARSLGAESVILPCMFLFQHLIRGRGMAMEHVAYDDGGIAGFEGGIVRGISRG